MRRLYWFGLLLLPLGFARLSEAQCGGLGPLGGGYVAWELVSNLSACPAGDSVRAGSPARLRITVAVLDLNCYGVPGIPPENMWVTFSQFTGNLKVNDKGAKVYADDSTNAYGQTRFTVPSFSGCGTVRVGLTVSGYGGGYKTVTIRTTDTNADGRTTSADLTGVCDLNYSGTSNGADSALVQAHLDHWRRNALHGTLVRRTNHCETCGQNTANTKGEGGVFWSPSQRYLSYTAFVTGYSLPDTPACKVMMVPSDPKDGNTLTQLTFVPAKAHDYDPSWSPLNTLIVFDRSDKFIIRKGLPWTVDTMETIVSTSDNPGCGAFRGDTYPAISPDGQWVAFTRCNGEPTFGFSVWKAPTYGGTAIQLTPAAARGDLYPSWSPDGQYIYFERRDAALGGLQFRIWKVPAAGGTAQEVFVPPASPVFNAVQPTPSPDGAIVVTGYGKQDLFVRTVVPHTLDLALAAPSSDKIVANYADTTFAAKGDEPILAPRLSPDGTRLVLGSKQIWAARRNMNLPPVFSSVTSTEEGTRALADTTASLFFTVFTFSGGSITVQATDPEGDALTYRADFLQSWMTWNASSHTLTLQPTEWSPDVFYVKFYVATASGGVDAFIAKILVGHLLGPSTSFSEEAPIGSTARSEGPNPTNGRFTLMAPLVSGATARLVIFDLSGRRMAAVHGQPGSEWYGKAKTGRALPYRTASIYTAWKLDRIARVAGS